MYSFLQQVFSNFLFYWHKYCSKKHIAFSNVPFLAIKPVCFSQYIPSACDRNNAPIYKGGIIIT